ncbi:MAG: hypothetical protein PHI18_10755 [bacterium]|nr:hypothetical protein [bacterium]
MISPRHPLAMLVLALLVSLPLLAEEAAPLSNSAAYPLDYCIVSGEKLGSMGEAVVKSYDGREVRFCCNSCVETFGKNQKKWTKKLDAAIAAAQKDDYPLETCVVTGEKLGEMGKPTEYVYQNRLVRFCCDGCIQAFNKEPHKYLAMLDAARARAQEPPAVKDAHEPESAGH